jgi:hypothetical protein
LPFGYSEIGYRYSPKPNAKGLMLQAQGNVLIVSGGGNFFPRIFPMPFGGVGIGYAF